MEKIFIHNYQSPVGELIIGSYKSDLVLCDWKYRKMRDSIDKRIQSGLNSGYVEEETPVIQKTIGQLDEYFSEKRKEFDIPLKFIGTDFQKSVWRELLKIPFGKTESYLGLSRKLNNEKAIRAVASANGANAISILVPCHRIVGSNQELTGYAGGLAAKKKLLTIENSVLVSRQLDLF